jgi:hypothetical protein
MKMLGHDLPSRFQQGEPIASSVQHMRSPEQVVNDAVGFQTWEHRPMQDVQQTRVEQTHHVTSGLLGDVFQEKTKHSQIARSFVATELYNQPSWSNTETTSSK